MIDDDDDPPTVNSRILRVTLTPAPERQVAPKEETCEPLIFEPSMIGTPTGNRLARRLARGRTDISYPPSGTLFAITLANFRNR